MQMTNEQEQKLIETAKRDSFYQEAFERLYKPESRVSADQKSIIPGRSGHSGSVYFRLRRAGIQADRAICHGQGIFIKWLQV